MIKKGTLSIAIMLISAFIISGCDIFDLIDINFTTDAVTIEMSIPPTDAQSISATYEEIDSEIQQEIENHGGNIDNLESAVISSLKIQLSSGAKNLNAFKNAEIFLSTNNISDKKVAWSDDIPRDTTVVFMQYTGDNLKDYLDDEQYKITLNGEVLESFTDTIFVDVIITYDISL